jgi:uncharacterized metal-binding protein
MMPPVIGTTTKMLYIENVLFLLLLRTMICC